MEKEGQAVSRALPLITCIFPIPYCIKYPALHWFLTSGKGRFQLYWQNLNLMKSLSASFPKRGARKQVIYSDFGIPVFLSGFGVPDALRHFAPDYVNWIDPSGNDSLPGEVVFSEPLPLKHTVNTGRTDSDSAPRPACPGLRKGQSE